MPVSFAGQPCLDPWKLWRACRRGRRKLPTGDWWGKANRFTCGLGARREDAGRGLVLLTQDALDQIDTDAETHSLVFDDGQGNVTLRNLHVVRSYAASPGAVKGDPGTARVVEVADPRDLFRYPIDRAYNVRDVTPGSAGSGSGTGSGSGSGSGLEAAANYCPGSTNAGQTWTWDLMVKDVWLQIPELAAQGYVTRPGTLIPPTLPFDPHGWPENWLFWGYDAAAALHQLLTRLGCALRYDPTQDVINGPYSIVRLGDAGANGVRQQNLAKARGAALTAGRLTWRGDPAESVPPRYPAQVEVLFQKYVCTDSCASPYDKGFVSAATADSTLAGLNFHPDSIVQLHDDLPSLYDDAGNALNGTDLSARALERAKDWYRIRKNFHGRTHFRYAGAFTPPEFLPGELLKSVSWYELGQGVLLEHAAWPDDELERWLATDPSVMCGGSVEVLTDVCLGQVGSGSGSSGPTGGQG